MKSCQVFIWFLLVGFFAFTESVAQPCVYPKPYEAFWSFDPGLGLLDSSSNEHDPMAITGILDLDTTEYWAGGQSVYFSGSDKIQYSDSSGFMDSWFDYRTISFWLLPDRLSGRQTLYEEGDTNRCYAVRLNGTNIEARVRSNALINDLSAPYPNDGQWHQVTLVFRGTRIFATGIFELYIDTTLVDSVSGVSVIAAAGGNLNPGGIGGTFDRDGWGIGQTNYFEGWMDEFMIMDTFLTAQDVYNSWACYQCPFAGTSCDDGDSLTYNDVEDGNCNCAGTPCAIFLDTVVRPIVCPGENNGRVDLKIGNGQAPFSVQWSSGDTIQQLSGMSPGIYSVSVVDANGCSATDTFEMVDPDPISINGFVTHPSTGSSADGAIDLNVTGGRSPYKYNWNDGSMLEDRSGLVTGLYYVAVNDLNGCKSFSAFTLTGSGSCIGSVGTPCDDGDSTTYNDQIDALCNCVGYACPPTTTSLGSTDNDCYGDSIGEVEAEITQGAGTYQYLWSIGDTSEDISGLPAGTYYLTVTDSLGCETVDTAIVREGDEILLGLNRTDPTNLAGTNGSYSSSLSGGAGDFGYLWSTGDTTSGLATSGNGIYSLTVTDKLGCTRTATDTFDGSTYPPNVLIVMTDDMGWGDVGYNGSIFETPHIDSMRLEGTQLTHFYTASASCSPTRASIMTGQNPFRADIKIAGDGRLDTSEYVISEFMSENGYATGMFGKWHLGSMTAAMYDAKKGAPGNYADFSPPWLHGFDEVFASETTVPTYNPMVDPAATAYPSSFSDTVNWYGRAFWEEPDTGIEGNRVGINDNMQGDAARIVMDRVIPFLDSANANAEPFFANVWLHTPHWIVRADSNFEDYYDSATFAGWSDTVQAFATTISAMDYQLARLTDYLKDAGLYDNTIIWFLSDNGGSRRFPTSNGSFRGDKGEFYEGGVRVPAFVTYPNGLADSSVMDAAMSTVDLFPTIAGFTSLSDSGLSFDGKDMSASIINEDSARNLPMIFLMFDSAKGVDRRALRTECYKINKIGSSWELFDLVNDTTESIDLGSTDTVLRDYLVAEFTIFENAIDRDSAYVVSSGFDECYVSPTPKRGLVLEEGPLEVAPELRMRFYPNPTSGLLFVDLPDGLDEQCLIEIIDLNGRVMRQQTPVPDWSSTIRFELGDLPSATYLLRASSGEWNYLSRIQLIRN